jgi:hypothetical protein
MDSGMKNLLLSAILILPIFLPDYIIPGRGDPIPAIYFSLGVGIDSTKNIGIKFMILYRF